MREISIATAALHTVKHTACPNAGEGETEPRENPNAPRTRILVSNIIERTHQIIVSSFSTCLRQGCGTGDVLVDGTQNTIILRT